MNLANEIKDSKKKVAEGSFRFTCGNRLIPDNSGIMLLKYRFFLQKIFSKPG